MWLCQVEIPLHHSSVTRTRDKKGHAQGHVTSTYKVTLDNYSVELYLYDIRVLEIIDFPSGSKKYPMSSYRRKNRMSTMSVNQKYKKSIGLKNRIYRIIWHKKYT